MEDISVNITKYKWRWAENNILEALGRDDIRKTAGDTWFSTTQDRVTWKQLGEAYIQR